MRQFQITSLVSVNIITRDIHNSLLCCRKDHIAIANMPLNTRRINVLARIEQLAVFFPIFCITAVEFPPL